MVKPMHKWLERLIYALLIGSVTIGLLMALRVVLDAFFNAPPLTLTSLDPADLGVLCPGDAMNIHNEVEIHDDIIVFYYVSTMDAAANSNVLGTQRAFVDQLHPHPARFMQTLPWTVPDLPPGNYTRVFGVRNVGSTQDVVFIVAEYEIKAGCPEPPLPR